MIVGSSCDQENLKPLDRDTACRVFVLRMSPFGCRLIRSTQLVAMIGGSTAKDQKHGPAIV
jgi:hypothetical protein